MPRHGWILLVLLPPIPLTLAAESAESTALSAWQKGQQAMLEGRTEEAITAFRQSLAQDPALVRNHLSLAAAHLALGQEVEALAQLQRYLRAQPSHFVVRAQYAEMLMRLERSAEARAQFERLEADLQDLDAAAEQQLVRCHSRLMEIAEAEEDEYGLHLHRGIGLYCLARERASLPDGGEGELSSEGLLFQAASEFALARLARPDEARPCWYLHEVWSRLGRRQPATRWLRAAEAAAPFSRLTPAEQRDLFLACRRLAEEGSHK